MNPVVLLVDDEQSICSALKRTFKQKHYQVFSANSGQEALELLQKNTVDVVISDQQMPGMKGTELLSIVKTLYPNIGRVILSGNSGVDDLTDAINEASIFRFLPKPWNEDLLIKTAQEAANVTAITKNKAKQNTASNTSEINRGVAPVIHIKEAYTRNQINLEKAIRDDQLAIEVVPYHHLNAELDNLNYLTISWPDHPRFQHDGIINIANQSGYLNDLFAWYLINAIDWVDLQANPTPMIFDIFTCSALMNPSMHTLLQKLLDRSPLPVVRIPYEALEKNFFESLLSEVNRSNSDILLNVGKRILPLSQLADTPVRYIEMDGKANSINNSLLTEKRLRMITDAQNNKIKTILSGNDPNIANNYAHRLGFDFY